MSSDRILVFFLYDVVQFFVLLLILPKVIWERFFKKRYKGRFKCLLGISIPDTKQKKGKVYLIYAVSMGETKAAASLFHKMKSDGSDSQYYIVSRTETGHAEAKRSMKGAEGYFLLPLDFSWVMKRFLNKIQPDVVIVVESDFWINFLRLSKKLGAQVFLVSGKVSIRSFKRFRRLSFFSKKLFSYFDFICAQNEVFKQRFVELKGDSESVGTTGNLKYDTTFAKVNKSDFKQKIGIQKQDQVIVLASTHQREEELLLEALKPLWERVPHLKVVIVPRHPERFSEVKQMIEKKKISCVCYSNIEEKTGHEKVVLVDTMGMLLSIYQVADLAIVGGSFLKELEGHNIYEPIQVGIPVLFGPYMGQQRSLVESVLSAEAGRQTCFKEVLSDVEDLLENQHTYQVMQAQGLKLLSQMEGSSLRTWEALLQKTKRNN